ncbi:MAG: pilus assembly PilX family protein [Shewanella sp.]
MKRQQGMVLVFALIVLIIMTLIGVALAVNAGQSLRMAGAGAERVEALSAAQGAQQRAIIDNKGPTLATLKAATSPKTDVVLKNVQTVISPSPLNTDVNCQRKSNASSANIISCRRVEVRSEAIFGRNELGRLAVVAGVEQEVLTGS